MPSIRYSALAHRRKDARVARGDIHLTISQTFSSVPGSNSH